MSESAVRDCCLWKRMISWNRAKHSWESDGSLPVPAQDLGHWSWRLPFSWRVTWKSDCSHLQEAQTSVSSLNLVLQATISKPKSYYVRLFSPLSIIHIVWLLKHIMSLLCPFFIYIFWTIISDYVEFSKTAFISLMSILLYQFFFGIDYFNYINLNTIMTLSFDHMYYVTHFFWHVFYFFLLFLFCQLLLLKHIMTPLKHLFYSNILYALCLSILCQLFIWQ